MALFNFFNKKKSPSAKEVSIYEEVIPFVNDEVKFGFKDESEILESIWSIGFINEDTFDENQLKKIIQEIYSRHQKDSKDWSHPTDFEKLAIIFDALNEEKIIALHYAGYTKQDGYGDVKEVIRLLKPFKIEPQGFCFYHTQDLLRAISPNHRNLFLAFDDVHQDDEKAVHIGKIIVSKLRDSGFEIAWNVSISQRIEIKNILWQKVPDDENWGIKRAMKYLTQT